MIRNSLKIVGAQGQGVNSVGEMVAKGLKRAGYCVFGYREYMSVIKGGHSSYQLDVSPEAIQSSETNVDILVCFNHHGLEKNLRELKQGGIILHQTGDWEWSKDDAAFIKKQKITTLLLPADEILAKLGAKPILANVLITSVVWQLLGQNHDVLREEVRKQFGKKGETVVAQNLACIDAGIAYCKESVGALAVTLPPSNAEFQDDLLLTGSQALGLGLVHAGCRMYVGYPMTPSSHLLSYIADIQNDTGMVIKQAEDEITAAQMMSGAMFMGTRAATGTSGGGFDLMTETLSMNGILENPAVVILAQRPGPATGLPTWTAQGDLFLAVHSAHGEFPRLVMAVSDAEDAFHMLPQAFNYAERFQTPVIVMTDKQCAEALYTQAPYDQSKTVIDRGNLVTDPKELAALTGADRYDPSAENGISKRWLPGSVAATYVAQSDEHGPDGSVNESADNAVAQMHKRMNKMEALHDDLPEPLLFVCEKGAVKKVSKPSGTYDLLLVTWGSTKGVVLDAVLDARFEKLRVAVVHYEYVWPLKTTLLEKVLECSTQAACVEGNFQGQLQTLLKAEDVDVPLLVHKYDGRPFFVDELAGSLSDLLA